MISALLLFFYNIISFQRNTSLLPINTYIHCYKSRCKGLFPQRHLEFTKNYCSFHTSRCLCCPPGPEYRHFFHSVPSTMAFRHLQIYIRNMTTLAVQHCEAHQAKINNKVYYLNHFSYHTCIWRRLQT